MLLRVRCFKVVGVVCSLIRTQGMSEHNKINRELKHARF